MTTKREYLAALDARMGGLPEAERRRVMDCVADMIDDRVEMGMPEEAAVSALGDVDALLHDLLPSPNAPVLQPDPGASDWRGPIREIHIHLKNADGRVVRRALPGDMTARIEASERDVFTWDLTDGVLTIAEAGEARRGLFQRSRELTLALDDLTPDKLIVDSYGGDIGLDGVDAASMVVLASSSGDIDLSNVTCGGRMEITCRSGDISLTDARTAADCKLEALSGDIEAARLSAGSLRMRTASGDIEGRKLQAVSLAAGTNSGDIDLTDIEAAGSVLCETASGDISLLRASAPDLRLSSTSGDIAARLASRPEGYNVAAASRSGDVKCPAGPSSDGAAQVLAQSVSGDIDIRLT